MGRANGSINGAVMWHNLGASLGLGKAILYDWLGIYLRGSALNKFVVALIAVSSLTACEKFQLAKKPAQKSTDAPMMIEEAPAVSAEPLTPPPAPPKSARTAEQYDTTTKEQRIAAVAKPAPAVSSKLGSTIASLGDPTSPGFWLKTPLVSAETAGYVTNPATGQTVQVTLIPIDGPKTGGSQISLAAMRLLGVGLTDLPKIDVFKNPVS